MLYVDDRSRGKHGIGRFAREAVGHLSVAYRSLGATGNPARPRDLVNPARFRLSSDDLIYTPGFNAGLTRAPQILTLHDLIHLQMADERSAFKTAYYERIVKPTVRRTGTVVTVSSTSAEAIRSWLDMDDVTVADVGNGCADLFFEDTGASTGANADDRPRLLYVGSMKPHKRPEVAFRLAARMPDATLTMVTNETDAVQRLAVEHGVVDRVRIEADCTDERLRTLYSTHTCLVFPSQIEGFGLPVVEAVAAGCQVLYWTGCASVDAILRGVGVAVDSVDDDAWLTAAESTFGRAFTRPPDWANRYSWAAVGARLDAVLR